MKRPGIVLLLSMGILTLAGCDRIDEFRSLFEKHGVEAEQLTWSEGAPPPQRNLALVLDNSGSMIRNDEQRMMLFSSLVFLDMLGDDDQLYLTSFPNRERVPSDRLDTAEINRRCREWIDSGDDEIGPLSNGAGGNDRLKNWVRELPYTSQITVFDEPIRRAIDNLQRMQPDGAARYLILFSDGNTDRGGTDRSAAQMEWIHKQESQTLLAYRDVLARSGIVFYGVVLGEATRTDHLEPLAEATGGAVLRASRPEDLVEKFAEVFGRILETRVEKQPLRKSTSVTINRYVKEFILFLPDRGDIIGMSFEEPGGRRITAPVGGSDGFLRLDRTEHLGPYQIIHVKDPRPGVWNFRLEGLADAEALLVQNYDVYLQIYGTYPRRGLMNVPNVVRGRLVDSGGQPIQDAAFFAEGDFGYRLDFADQSADGPPDEGFGFEFEIIPRDTLYHDLVCTADNGSWLNRTIKVEFGGKDGAILRVNNDAEFGEVVPYADGLYFWWCRWLTRLLGLPNAEAWRHNKAIVRFDGSDPALRGVVFDLDEDELYRRHHLKLVDRRHRQRFVIDDNYEAVFHLDLDRSARRLDERLMVPIVYPSDAGKIRGDRHVGLQADVQELNWAWRTSHLWLQWLIYLWLFLFFIYRPLHYTLVYSTRAVRYYPSLGSLKPSRPDPAEGAVSAFLKALVLLYPLFLVKSVSRSKGGKTSPNQYVASGPDVVGARALQLVLGVPAGSFLRPFRAKLGQTRRVQFYRAGNVIMTEARNLPAPPGQEADPDRSRLKRVPGAFAYEKDRKEQDRFRIKIT